MAPLISKYRASTTSPFRHTYRLRNSQYCSEPLSQSKRLFSSIPKDTVCPKIVPGTPPKRACLTKKNLKALENMGSRRGGIGKASGRGKISAASSSARKSSPASSCVETTTDSESDRYLSTTKPGFKSLALRNGILNEKFSKPPANLKERQSLIDIERCSASPTESEYEYFASCVRGAANEATITREVDTLLKRHKQPGYQAQSNAAFSNFPKDVGFNNGLSAAQPDIVEGLNASEFDQFPVFTKLSGAATPYGNGSDGAATTLPHIAGELKGPGGNLGVSHLQGAYDGACMVYGRNEARSFLQKPDPPNHAFVSTFTSDGRSLDTFAHYASETEGQVKYHQYLTSTTPLISSFADFKKGRQRLRNLQDNAREESYKLKDELSDKWLKNPTTSPQIFPKVISGNNIAMSSPENMQVDTSETFPEHPINWNDEEDGDCDPNNRFLFDNWDQVNVSQHGTVLDNEY